MGGCFSNLSISGDVLSSSANVITIDGQLRQFPVPISVSLVLQQMESTSSLFVCNSDSLFYDELIPALDSEYQLQSGQIYFVLPNSKLRFPLSASEMAALAVKASVALSSINSNRRSKSRISPALVNESVDTVSVYGYNDDGYMNILKRKNTSTSTSTSAGVSRSGSTRKLQRYSSRRAKVAVRSFRIKLTTIYEGSDLQFY